MSDVSSKAEATAAGRAAPASGTKMATNRADLVPPGSRMTVDFATILGLIGGFGMIFAAMSISGSSAAFLDVPSVLIELGYMTNRSDLRLLTSEAWRAKTAKTMVQAVEQFFRTRIAGAEASVGRR